LLRGSIFAQEERERRAPEWPLQFVRFITLSQLVRRIGN